MDQENFLSKRQFSMSLIAVIALAIFANTAFAHEWNDSSGNYSVDAELISLINGTVTLQKRNGKLITVPLERLSNADQAYATQWKFSFPIPDGFSFIGQLDFGKKKQFPYNGWILQSKSRLGTRDTVIIFQREDGAAFTGIQSDFALIAATLFWGLNESPKTLSTFRIPKDESTPPQVYLLVEQTGKNTNAPSVRAGMNFVDKDNSKTVIVSASCNDKREFFERRHIDDLSVKLADALRK